jgi:hypothetical protein
LGRSANWRWIYPSGSFGQNALRSIAGSSAKQPSIVLFMFKHCFHYDFTIGFVCGSWLRLRKISLSVGFIWPNRISDRPLGSFAQTGPLECSSRTNAACLARGGRSVRDRVSAGRKRPKPSDIRQSRPLAHLRSWPWFLVCSIRQLMPCQPQNYRELVLSPQECLSFRHCSCLQVRIPPERRIRDFR